MITHGTSCSWSNAGAKCAAVMDSMVLPLTWPSTFGKPCIPPRPQFPRHSFKHRNAAKFDSERCLCNCQLEHETFTPAKHLQRRSQRAGVRTFAVEQSNAVVDTGQELSDERASDAVSFVKCNTISEWRWGPTIRPNVTGTSHAVTSLQSQSWTSSCRAAHLQQSSLVQTCLMLTWMLL